MNKRRGFVTFTKKNRNFNVTWKGEGEAQTSIAYLSEYELTPAQYCKKPLYWLQNNLDAPGLKHDWPPEKSDLSSVTMQGGPPKFKLTSEPLVLTFSDRGLIAVAGGQFTDHWERV